MKPRTVASIDPAMEERETIELGVSAILACYRELGANRALLAGVSGIDGSGKGYLTAKIVARLREHRRNVVGINADGWLNLPHVRFGRERPAEQFYEKGLRLDEMFEKLIVPLKEGKSIRIEADYAEETATSFRRHTYEYDAVEIIVLEGIYLFKREYQRHFDLRIWIDCSFETALSRAIARGQEGLSAEETVRAYETIYFPAQEIHFSRDEPRAAAHLVLDNDGRR